MDTEQQQEFKSEKRRTGSQIKTILFTDHSIESWRPKKDRDRLCFARSNITKGIKVIYRKKTNQKYWELAYSGTHPICFTNCQLLGSYL